MMDQRISLLLMTTLTPTDSATAEEDKPCGLSLWKQSKIAEYLNEDKGNLWPVIYFSGESDGFQVEVAMAMMVTQIISCPSLIMPAPKMKPTRRVWRQPILRLWTTMQERQDLKEKTRIWKDWLPRRFVSGSLILVPEAHLQFGTNQRQIRVL